MDLFLTLNRQYYLIKLLLAYIGEYDDKTANFILK